MIRRMPIRQAPVAWIKVWLRGLIRLDRADVFPSGLFCLISNPQLHSEGTPDRLEAEGLCFQERVRAAYLELAQREPERICVVDASGSPEMVHDRIIEALGDLNLPFAAGVS